MFQIFLNNGEIFTVADMLSIPTDFIGYPNSGVQVAPWSLPVSWINGQSYIQDSWEAHYSEGAGHTYGWFNNLKGRATKATHQEYLNKVLQNGAFIWGDAYNGGLYIYKSYYREGYTTGCLYGLALFCGYGIDNNDSNYDIFSIIDYPTASGLTWEQIETISVIRWYSLWDARGWDTEEYYSFLLGGNIIEDGHCVTKQGFGQLEANNPLNPEQYTGISYTFSMSTTLDSETLQDYPEYVTIQPLNPLHASYQSPMKIWMKYKDGEGYGYTSPQNFGEPTTYEREGFDTMGDWAGGTGNVVKNDPNSGTSEHTGGGYGTPSKYSDRSGDTTEEQFGYDAVTSGSVTIFNPSHSQMQAFNRWLFQSFLSDGFNSIWNNLKKIYADPVDYIVGMGMIKYHPTREISANEEICFSGVGTTVFSRAVKQWSTLEFGSITIDEQYKTALDYQGYSATQIYLPFCGTFDLPQNDVMGSNISLTYNIDNLTGACVAVLDVTRSDRGTKDDSTINSKIFRFTGNCMQQLPISAKDYRKSVEAIAGVIGGASQGATSGNYAGAIVSVADGILNMGPQIVKSGNISDCLGMLDCLTPFVILHRPIRSIPEQYGSNLGYPSNKLSLISTCVGYTKVRSGTEWTTNIHCTDEEKQEIQNYLENGIYIDRELAY